MKTAGTSRSRPSSACCAESTSGDGDRRARVEQVDPGEALRKMHRLAVGPEDLQWLLGIGEVPFRGVAMALAKHIRRTGPLEIEVGVRDAQHFGEARGVH